MTVLAGDVLRPVGWSNALQRHWRGLDLFTVASGVADAAGLTGLLLPYTRVADRPAFPLVTVNGEVATQRLSSRQGPILDRSVLQDHADAGFAEAPPEAVALAGFVVVEPFATARKHLVGLSAWAPTVLAVPSWRPLDPISLAQCDVHGHRVLVSDGVRASLMPTGGEGRPRRSIRGDVWARLRDEQMFQLALESGLVSC